MLLNAILLLAAAGPAVAWWDVYVVSLLAVLKVAATSALSRS
jgi:hypothetical protein